MLAVVSTRCHRFALDGIQFNTYEGICDYDSYNALLHS